MVTFDVPLHPPRPLIRFLGGTRTVTGSRFLVETPTARVLVDCGMFQGLKDLRQRNWQPFPVDPRTIDAVVLTHAHIDHSGWLPALVRDGFTGSIVSTTGTAELCKILLPDSGRIQEEDARYSTRKGFSRHEPALPLYTEDDAFVSLEHFRPVPYHAEVPVAPGMTVELQRAGHILGSASAVLRFDGYTVCVSGDLGRTEHPLLAPADPPPGTAALLVESTYGDRSHTAHDGVGQLADAIVSTAQRGGAVVIPAFAVDRTEVVLYHLHELIAAGRIPDLPIYVDSPTALDALAVYRRAIDNGDAEIRQELHGRSGVLSPGRLIVARTVAESKAINEAKLPAIIVSASGMATGGRVLHHLARHLPDPDSTVILVGYQAQGTRGDRLVSGERSVKMLGRYVPVRAQIVDIDGFSVHADREEILAWLGRAPRPPDVTLVVHGEEKSSESLRDEIVDRLGWNAAVPRHDERVLLPRPVG